MAGHASRNRMNCKSGGHATGFECVYQLGHRMLGVGNGHPVAGHDYDGFRRGE